MENNFKKYTIKIILLLSLIALLYFFIDSLSGSIVLFTKLNSSNYYIKMFRIFALCVAGLCLIMFVLISIDFFIAPNKIFSFVVFIIAIISIIANIAFLVFSIVDYDEKISIAISVMPSFITYIVISVVIATCYLIKYIDFIKSEEMQITKQKISQKTSKWNIKHTILIILVSVCSILLILFLSLFISYATTSHYKKDKFDISYTNEFIYTRNYDDDEVKVLYAISIVITKGNSYDVQIKYLYNGEELVKNVHVDNIDGKNYVNRVSIIDEYINSSDIISEPLVKTLEINYLKNGEYVATPLHDYVYYSIGEKELAFMYCACSFLVLDIVFICLLIKNNKNKKVNLNKITDEVIEK